MDARVWSPTRAFASFDAVILSDLFESRPRVMQSVSWSFRGASKLSMRSGTPRDLEWSGTIIIFASHVFTSHILTAQLSLVTLSFTPSLLPKRLRLRQ